MAKIVSACFVVLISCACVFGALIPKQLAGPPSEFAERAIPSTQMGSLQSRSALLEIEFQDSDPKAALSAVTWTGDIYVETPSAFAFSFYSPEQFTLVLTDSNGQQVDIASHAQPGVHPIYSYNFVPTVSYIFNDNTLSVGTYTLSITSQNKYTVDQRKSKNPTPRAVVIVFNDSPLYMHTYLSTYNVDVGKPVGLMTQMSAAPRVELGVIPKALVGVVSSARMEVFLPDGVEVDVPMYDDGLHGDGLANDGLYAGQITATEPGTYRASALLQGTTADGVSFMKSTEHLINVIDTLVTFDGSATGEMKDQERMVIYVGVNVPETNTLTTFRAYSEVWGKDASGNDVAVCWISSISNIQNIGGENVIPLELNLKWANLAGAQAPFTLKNSYILDPYSVVPVDTSSQIPVKTTGNVNKLLRKPHMQVTEATKEMKQGKYPAGFLDFLASNDTAHDGVIILVHGYCAGTNPWQANPGVWKNAEFFINANANIGTQKFSELVDAYAASKGYEYFSIVGHSQGGMVGAHLHNFFFTGMDKLLEKRNLQNKAAAQARLIQSLGTPYLGCSGAGSAANLAKTFGAGCGENYDLTTDGASVWLTGITTDTRSEVFYYTTTYKLGNLFGDYCNLAVNFVLEWPNDGTSETVYTKLSGGTDLGNTQKQCHTTDMGYPAQYYDQNRNSVMNANAAR